MTISSVPTAAAAPSGITRFPLPLSAVLVPVVTPLLPDATPDLDSLDRLLDYSIAAGVDGLLVLGSSGEAVALSAAERSRVAARAVEHCRGRAHVMLGVVAHGTKDAAADARHLDALAPDSLLVCAPSGLRMSQGELGGHFREIAAVVETPVVAYDVPSRVGISLSADLVAEMAAGGVIAGIKDSSGDLVHGRAVSEATRHIKDFVRYTGCEQVIDGAVLGGYHGAIPGLANVFPEFHVELMRRAATADWAGASEVQGLIMQLLELYFHPLENAGFSAQFQAVVKEALVQLGVIAYGRTSPPFVQADASAQRHVTAMLELAATLRPQLMRQSPREPSGVTG